MSEEDHTHPKKEVKNDQVISEIENLPPFPDIMQDPEYNKLETEFQQGRWQSIQKSLENLEKKYPGNKKLSEFKNDFDLHYSISAETSSHGKTNKKEFRIHITKSALIYTLITLVILAIGFLSYIVIRESIQRNTVQKKTDQINTFSTQVVALINSGQPEKAQQIIKVMDEIDPTNPEVARLSQEVDQLSEINNQYITAIDYINQGQFESALPILTQINEQIPNYKDVPQLVETTARKVEVSQALINGKQAYTNKEWQKAIDNFERILELDPNNPDPTLKDLLLNSYLKRIIQMLESETTNVEEIASAETYYRRAIAMIPQSRSYMSERENLQKASRDLLQLKYTQTAYSIINDPQQSLDSVNQAMNYLRKAANLDSTNSSLQMEANKITLYQAGFQYFLEMNWAAAIQQFTSLITIDSSYANGFAQDMLYEAHINRGIQYDNVGFYLDARKEFEAAEGLELGDANLFKRFSAELKIAEVLGKMAEYEDSASYYKYAFLSINYEQWSNQYSDLVGGITDAINLYNVGSYKDSSEKFAQLLPQVSSFYSIKEVPIHQGNCFALIAAQYGSSVQEILAMNELPQLTRATSDQILHVPVFEK